MSEQTKETCGPWQWDRKTGIAATIHTMGWALFFIWVGIALVLDVGWGTGLIGVGVITMSEQAARWLFRLRLEGFWVCVGMMFVLGGLWELYDFLFPFLLIGAGVALFLGALSRRWR